MGLRVGVSGASQLDNTNKVSCKRLEQANSNVLLK